MRKTLLFIILTAMALTGRSQESVDATAEYYARQYVRIQKAFVENPDDVAVHLELARFYSQSDNPMRNLPSAMAHIMKAESDFVEIVSDPNRSKEGRKLIKQKLNINSIRNLRQQIVAQARKDVDSRLLTDEQKDAYIIAFGDDATIGRQIKKQRLEQAYATACEANTVEAYYRFIGNYSGTSEAESAEASIARLAPKLFEGIKSTADVDSVARQYADSPSVQRQAEKSKSRIAFAAAMQKHSVQGYRDFIADHPSGDEYSQALEALDNLRAQQYQRLRTPEEYADFIAANNDDPLAEKAMDVLRAMVGRNHDAVAAKMYLKRFPLDPQHSTLFQEYYEWISAEGNRQPIATFAQEYPDYPYPTEVEEDLHQAAKIDAFPLNTPFTEADFVPYASFMRMNSEKRIALVALQRTLQHLCAQHNWKNALARMDDLDLVFDNANKPAFMALRNLLSKPADPRTHPTYETFPSINLLHPVPHPDGRHLYFTRQDDNGSSICVATLTDAKTGPRWSLGEPIQFANVENKGLTIYSFYDGGNHMVLGKDGDIWFAVRDGYRWRVTETPSYPLNTDYQEVDACMTPDGSGLLMASDRPLGYNFQPSRSFFHGDTALATDLYFVPLTTQGWGTPVNLGPKVNTCYAEGSPVLSRNLKTLYFVSDGHMGLGYGDIFMTTRADVDSWTGWSDPVNLGREANTGFNEASVSLTADEGRLFVASDFSGGRYGCYSVGTFHDTVLNHRILTLDVAAFDGRLMKVDICEAEHHKVRQTVLYPDSDTLFIPLTKGRRYVMFVTASQQFVPAQVLPDDTVSMVSVRGYSIDQLYTLHQPLPLPLVTFEKYTSQMEARSVTQLDQLALFMKEFSDCRVTLSVDVSGRDDAGCYRLANECGQSVRRYLLGQGIPQERLGVAAYGNSRCRDKKNKKILVSLIFSKMQ